LGLKGQWVSGLKKEEALELTDGAIILPGGKQRLGKRE
jgi:hypothetical protein